MAAIALAGCQTTSTGTGATAPSTSSSQLVDPKDDFGDAMMQPFTDFNITRDPIPPQLEAAARRPYAPPADLSCPALAADIRRLDSALGPDLDAADGDEGDDAAVNDMVTGALRSLTTGWIPFRGVIRKMTGAEAHEEKAREAILSGAVRRAYLKGLGERGECASPAAPRRANPAAG
ncbi:MAG: hypothetical protein ACK4YQ_12180 [Phenylobacterium sp.]|uniref:hypothetical protein n=1 Tax=Phenylobacterium sp. TaxID=1871053 RepID=UPI00391B9605